MNRHENAAETAKWIALVAMVVDHAGHFFFPDLRVLRLIGRLSLPLFCWVIALRLAEKPERETGYLKRLTLWAVISQPLYWLGFHTLQPIYQVLNIMATLWLGVLLFAVVRRETWWRWPVVAALLPLGHWCSYGVMGAAMVPILALVAKDSVPHSALATGAAGSATSFFMSFYNLANYWGSPLAALASGTVAWLCLKLPVTVPRLPRWFFYAFYPLHIFVFIVVLVLLERLA